MATKKFVVGLKWKKLGNESPTDENEDDISPTGPRGSSRFGKFRALRDRNGTDSTRDVVKKLVRMNSVRDAFGSIREKLRVSTRRKKRLINSPAGMTPGSVQRRRSARLAASNSEVKMYSPFNIDTPNKTPGRIRMGVHGPKRFDFSSPTRFQKDVDVVSQGIACLTRNATSFSKASQSPSSSSSTGSDVTFTVNKVV
ncbi:hypothetical protein CAPTEDRAFT_195514 [Capitella teleta]|uniref:Uncharacterized protein n=1 Tax=Capitella teleta TaxID=283909 RepID=R7VDS3_CAPTE|nr:hypothetical protein CAPTEDRAFT_195514 [Capitella teleta]|eukprot:ELU13830.1 hypothetical protein CAPTEDRAFT_195514 [Capitella teleta]